MLKINLLTLGNCWDYIAMCCIQVQFIASMKVEGAYLMMSSLVGWRLQTQQKEFKANSLAEAGNCSIVN